MSALIFDDEYTGPRFRYGLTFRPPMVGGIPEGYIINSDRKHYDFAFGTLDWPRQLTEHEVSAFELTPINAE